MIKINTEQYIQKAKSIHGNRYDYSLVDYIGALSKIKIICREHGIFEQFANQHIRKQKGRTRSSGCPKCFWKNYTMAQSQFIQKANEVHGKLYDYSLVEYINIHTKVKIICHKHGIFEQEPNKHVSFSHGCPKCKSSKGELAVIKYLKENNVRYETQKRFNDCRDKLPLPFDFYLPEYNICIEYDGEQHTGGYRFYSKDVNIKKLELTKQHDKIKTDYCKQNDILLIRIPYTVKQNIESILAQFLCR